MAVISYRQALHDTLRVELARDRAVFLLGEDIGVFEGVLKVTSGLLAEFGPKRVRDCPMSRGGVRRRRSARRWWAWGRIVAIMTINFVLVAMDMLVNHAAKVHYMFGGQVNCESWCFERPRGGGHQLAAPRSQNLANYFAYIPGLRWSRASNQADAKGLLKTGLLRNQPGHLHREPRALQRSRARCQGRLPHPNRKGG